MPVTSPAIVFGRNAMVITENINTITVVNGGLSVLGNVDDLRNSVAVKDRAITHEPDFWLMDGSYKFAPVGSHFGYISSNLSDGSGVFAGPVPQIQLTFKFTTYNTNGLTLFFDEFSGDWCNSITVAFYNASSVLIRSDTYTPTSAVFATGQAVSGFKRIDISFNSTNKPYRFARLGCIHFDDTTVFADSEIKSANLVEEIDPISINMHSNTVEFVVHLTDTGFSITDPSGFYANLRDNEPLEAYEKIDEDVIFLGRFYLDKWESLSENEASFHAYDQLYQLENYKKTGDLFSPTLPNSTNATFGGFISLYVTPYYFSPSSVPVIDAALGSPQMYGLTPVNGDVRKYLQSGCFAVGGYATFSRSRWINIRKTVLASSLSSYDFTLTESEIGLNPQVSLLPLITGVELNSYDYAQQTNPSYILVTAYNQAVTLSQVISLLFDNPTYGWTAGTGNTATVSNFGSANWLVGTVTVAGTWVLDVKEFVDGKNLQSQYTAGLPTGTTPNVIKIEDEKLISSHNVAAVLSLVYNYYQQRYKQTIKLYASRITVGSSVYMPSQSGKHLKGIVERMETDLANGFVSTCDVVGVIV